MICQKVQPDFKNLELLYCGEVTPDPDWHMVPHLHPLHELIVVMKGTMILKTSHENLKLRAGDILFYQAGLIHEEASVPDDPVHILFAGFQCKDPPPFPLLVQDHDGRIRQITSWLLADSKTQQGTSSSLHLLQSILGEMTRLQSKPLDPWLLDFREYMQIHFQKHLPLSKLAQRAGLSRFAFARKFKSLAGVTPTQELRLIRLFEARRLLLTSNMPLKMIAPKTGLGDEYQLSKLFRRHFKLSPREMRQWRSMNQEDTPGS